jgi:hypothetical protein
MDKIKNVISFSAGLVCGVSLSAFVIKRLFIAYIPRYGSICMKFVSTDGLCEPVYVVSKGFRFMNPISGIEYNKVDIKMVSCFTLKDIISKPK